MPIIDFHPLIHNNDYFMKVTNSDILWNRRCCCWVLNTVFLNQGDFGLMEMDLSPSDNCNLYIAFP